MTKSFFAAALIGALTVSSAAFAAPWDPANSTRDNYVESLANSAPTSGSAISTNDSGVLAVTPSWDPANSSRDRDVEARANAVSNAGSAISTNDSGVLAVTPSWDPANSTRDRYVESISRL